MSVIPSTVDRVRRHAATVKRVTHCKPRASTRASMDSEYRYEKHNTSERASREVEPWE